MPITTQQPVLVLGSTVNAVAAGHGWRTLQVAWRDAAAIDAVRSPAYR